jgi:hypothetical protein
MNTTADLEQRVQTLEHRNHAMLCGLAAAGVLFAALLFRDRPPQESIEARRFVLKDENGNERAVLLMRETGPALAMFDADGKQRVGLVVDPAYATLDFRTRKGGCERS